MNTPTVLSDLLADPANARVHTERNVALIASALQEVGAGRSIVIDEDGVILAGNATVQAAARVGKNRVRVVEADGDEIIAVRRSNLSPSQKSKLALFDNRAAELAAGWDPDVLREMQAQGLELGDLWSPEELDAIYTAATVVGGGGGLTDPDTPTPGPDEVRTEIVLGDLFELGQHRIICGDSTKAEYIERLLAGALPSLMVTDPPYGINYDPSWRATAGVNKNKKKLGKVANDDQADWLPAWDLFPGDVAYVYHAALKSSIVAASLELSKFSLRAQIIWAKDRLALGRGDYHWQHEPCWYGVREGKSGKRNRDRSQATLWRISTPAAWLGADGTPIPETSTVWEIPSRDDAGHGHGTQKPVECMARPMRNHAAPEVYEPFSGSGTTLIAGQMLGRKVYACELLPAYVQIAIDRWEAHTGKKAVKVGEAPRG